MLRTPPAIRAVAVAFFWAAGAAAQSPAGGAMPGPAPVTIRVATFNLQDVRTSDLADPANPRLRGLAEVIQRVRPTVILLNEIAWDRPGSPGASGQTTGRNGLQFADAFLAVAQASDVEPLRYRAFMAPVNTGAASGMDLDHDGRIVTTYPVSLPGSAAATSDAAREYGSDCWGYGTFPGQYGMALLVDERLDIVVDEVRTFRLLPWSYIPGAHLPVGDDGRTPWYTAEEQARVRLSSKSHWDVPVRLPGGSIVHFLASHPTPPAFDGPERRNARRNHDEIRFWADYLANESYIVDDNNQPGGLDEVAFFILLGDLNADPDEGDAFKDPINTLLFSSRRIDSATTPRAARSIGGLDDDDTASFGLRVDYVLPSVGLEVRGAGIWRDPPIVAGTGTFPSDHFPVWLDVTVPPHR